MCRSGGRIGWYYNRLKRLILRASGAKGPNGQISNGKINLENDYPCCNRLVN